MLETLGTIMASSGFGATVGGIFGWLNRKEDRKDRESDRRFQVEKLKAETEANTQRTTDNAFASSQETKSKVSDVIKSMVRPIITGLLMWQLFVILAGLEEITGGLSSLPPELAIQLYRDIVLNVISLASMAVSWWFASRPSSVNKA